MLILHYSPPPVLPFARKGADLQNPGRSPRLVLFQLPIAINQKTESAFCQAGSPSYSWSAVLALCDSFICLGLPLLCPRIAWNSNLILKRDGRGALPLVHYTEWKKDSVCLGGGGGGGGSLCVSLANLWDCGSRLRFAFL